MRFRCDYFPFVEPGVEMAIDCLVCGGAGCRTCGGKGWIEILGAGMVHPEILSNMGYDAERYTGFAAGMGIERIPMLRVRHRRYPAVLRERPALLEAVLARRRGWKASATVICMRVSLRWLSECKEEQLCGMNPLLRRAGRSLPSTRVLLRLRVSTLRTETAKGCRRK